jgi:hypothetical protein
VDYQKIPIVAFGLVVEKATRAFPINKWREIPKESQSILAPIELTILWMRWGWDMGLGAGREPPKTKTATAQNEKRPI